MSDRRSARGTAGFSGGRDPLAVDSPLVDVAWPVGSALLVTGLVAAVVSSVLRYRRARGVERQQLKWFAYDIDRIVSRTLAWALLTVVLGLGYAGVVVGLSWLLPRSSSLAVAAATLAVAAVFQPVRRRIQAAVDRRFNRRRYDATGPSRCSAAGCGRRSTWTP